MIYLTLFLTFFYIGAFSFGGGYGMLPLMEQTVVVNGWIDESEFMNFVAIAESTPGPIAVNMATFIGSTQGGLLGSVLATLGIITPSIIVILLIVAVFRNFLRYRSVRCVLEGIKPVVVGLIFATGLWLGVKNFLPNIAALSAEGFSPKSLILTFCLLAATVVYKKIRKKNLSPILIILVSAGVGMLLFR